MYNLFQKYQEMLHILHISMPHIRAILRENWENIMDSNEHISTEYYHRIYDGRTRQMVDTKYHSMKEIVENVYYNIIPQDNVEHYLVKKYDNLEMIIRLKCRGIIPSYNESN